MSKTLPRRANQVLVHPPMSQIRIGAVAWIVAIGSRLPVAPAGNGYLVRFSLAASSRLRNPTERIKSAREAPLHGGRDLCQPARVEDSSEVEVLELHEALTFEVRGGAAHAFERQPEETGDVRARHRQRNVTISRRTVPARTHPREEHREAAAGSRGDENRPPLRFTQLVGDLRQEWNCISASCLRRTASAQRQSIQVTRMIAWAVFTYRPSPRAQTGRVRTEIAAPVCRWGVPGKT